MRRRLLTLSGAGALALGLSTAPTVFAQDRPEQSPPERTWEVTEEILAASVARYDAPASIAIYDTESSIQSLGDTELEDDVIVLEADILFAAMEWELSEQADARIVDLTEQVPEGASIEVHGHTDSNPMPAEHDVDNQGLSENRAQAVADVLAEERPDLELNVEGFGADQPAETEDPDDPGTYAANRRVEIRYD